MEDKELAALIRLLDDPDDVVYPIIEQKLLSIGKQAIPGLEKAWENTMNEFLHKRIENVIQKIQFSAIKSELREWNTTNSSDLLRGAYLVAKYQYPDLDYELLYKQIETIYRDTWIGLRENLTPLEQIRIINHIFYEVYKFAGNNANFFAPQNSYMNHVLETKKGNTVTLAIIYSLIAQKLGIPVYGVNLPKNYILAYVNNSSTTTLQNTETSEVLFYINPYNRGVVLGKREIDSFLKQQNIEPVSSYYTPCGNDITIQRLILNLVYSYERLGYINKMDDLRGLLTVFDNKLQDKPDFV